MEAMNAARASGGSIFDVLDRKPAIDSLSTEGARSELKGDLSLKDVHFTYPARLDVKVFHKFRFLFLVISICILFKATLYDIKR
jgi:ATP-binding cassette, subfamily B (MDR/TAP), member 1